MDILRFTTAGSVDDGKSTLIGRLLYDTGNIKQDVLQSVSMGEGEINLAHLTDGLRAERAQGITIDVAYKYFSTPERKYIITDAPGHFQYTRNLVTGASSVDAMIILIDAQNGITSQTKIHTQVAAFLGISNIVVAVNKMDAVDFDETVFTAIVGAYNQIAEKLGIVTPTFIPISALGGDNISFLSTKMVWYNGEILLKYLENCPVRKSGNLATRFSIQYAINSERVGLETGYAGKLLSGTIKLNDIVELQPGQRKQVIAKILDGSSETDTAEAGKNLCIYFKDLSDAKRGDIVCDLITPPTCTKTFEIIVCWLSSERDVKAGDQFLMRLNAFETSCEVTQIMYKTDNTSFEPTNADSLSVNDFGKLRLTTQDMVAIDSCSLLPENGRGILIDLATHNTVGAFTVC